MKPRGFVLPAAQNVCRQRMRPRLHVSRLSSTVRNPQRNTRVRIVFSTDDICAACPNKIRDGVCLDDDKVLSYDKMVRERFGVGEKDYDYGALIAEIDKMITPEIMDEICGSCRWYAESACRDRVCFSKAQGDSWKQKTGC